MRNPIQLSREHLKSLITYSVLWNGYLTGSPSFPAIRSLCFAPPPPPSPPTHPRSPITENPFPDFGIRPHPASVQKKKKRKKTQDRVGRVQHRNHGHTRLRATGRGEEGEKRRRSENHAWLVVRVLCLVICFELSCQFTKRPSTTSCAFLPGGKTRSNKAAAALCRRT